jgi:hypothetical protein
MIQKKVCILGAFGVGKTSLVSQFVHSKFSDKYLSTMGVKIDRKQLTVDGRSVSLMLWDIHGEEEYKKIPASYLRGASGIIFVIDGTRRDTLETAREILERFQNELGELPSVTLFNKHDLLDEWSFTSEEVETLSKDGSSVYLTSAKTGEHVEEAFRKLAGKLVKP